MRRKMADILSDRLRTAIESRMLLDFVVEKESTYEGLFVDFSRWMQLRHRDSGEIYHLDVAGESVRIFHTEGPTANYLLETIELDRSPFQVPNVDEFAREICEYINKHHELELDPATHYFES